MMSYRAIKVACEPYWSGKTSGMPMRRKRLAGIEAGLGDDLGDGAAEAADQRVLLDGNDDRHSRHLLDDGRGVERLESVNVKHAGGDASAFNSAAAASATWRQMRWRR